MGQLFDAIVEFFENERWNFRWIEGETALSMGFEGKSGRWICYVQVREAHEQVVFYSICPINVPDRKRAGTAEFLTRANYGMILGNFEMDYSDGEVRYKTSIDLEGVTLLPPMVKSLVYTNLLMMDRYLPGILSICYGDADPAQQIQQIERQFRYSAEEDDDPDDNSDFLLPGRYPHTPN